MTNLLGVAEDEGIAVYDFDLPESLKGIYYDYSIAINRKIKTRQEGKCILAEELGHYFTTVGCILDMKIESNKKQEKRAIEWAFEKLVPFDRIVAAYSNGYESVYELAECLDVTEDFLKEAILYYQKKGNINGLQRNF